MKKFKMIVSVFMVMVLTLSVFSFTASAASTNQPRAALVLCPECVQITARYIDTVRVCVSTHKVYTCDYVMNELHDHEVYREYDVLNCSNCGRVEVDVDYPVYCTKIGYDL